MNLRHLSSKQLLNDTEELVKRERGIMIEVLFHIQEVCRRKAFSPEFKSPHDYIIRGLGYSEDEASRRFSAVMLMRDLPEIAPAIAEGSLSLTNLVVARSFFRSEEKHEKLSKESKLETLKEIENLSIRKAARVLIQKATQPLTLKPESVRPVSATQNELRIYADDETLEIIQQLKGILAHKHPGLSTSELLKIMAKETLEKLNPGREPKRTTKKKVPDMKPLEENGKSATDDNLSTRDSLEKLLKSSRVTEAVTTSASPRRLVVPPEDRRVAGAALKRELYRRAQGKCEDCGSIHGLQYEHRKSFALGGKTTLENMKLLCFHCNQRKRISEFGYRGKEVQREF